MFYIIIYNNIYENYNRKNQNFFLLILMFFAITILKFRIAFRTTNYNIYCQKYLFFFKKKTFSLKSLINFNMLKSFDNH